MPLAIVPPAPSPRAPSPSRLEALAWAFAEAPDPVFVADSAGGLVWSSPTEPGVDAAFARAFPGDAAEVVRDAIGRVIASGEPARCECGESGPAGIRSWFACVATPLRENATLVGVLVRATDVTARRQSEERFRLSEQLMVDTQGVAHLGTWEWDVRQPHATWSEELYRIYGLTPETYTPSYERYLTMIHPDDRDRVIEATNRVFHEHVPYSHDERIFRPDGTMRYLHTWARPLLDDAGRLVKLLGVCQDITDRKAAEEEVRQLNQDLERRVAERTRSLENSMRDLEAFNSMVTHDLRAPVTTIELNCSLLLERASRPLGDGETEKVQRIRRAASRMGELITDLLTLARVNHGPLACTDVDVTALANEILSGLSRAAPSRPVELVVAEDLRCRADPGLLRAALENLLGNAWKYSSKVPVARIELGSAATADGSGFFVRDNGAGFDMAHAERLFQPFQRLHARSEFDGTGVGLAAVHRIVERHGGRISADARPGAGATFTVILPR